MTVRNAPTAPRRHSRSRTLCFVRTVRVPTDAESTFGFISDFDRAVEWRSEVVRSVMDPPAPMRAGTRLYEAARIAGRRVVTESLVTEVDPPHGFTFAHLSGPLPVSGEYAIAPGAAGTTVTYTLRVTLTAGWSLLAPVLRHTGPLMIDRSLRRLAAQLSALSVSPATDPASSGRA